MDSPELNLVEIIKIERTKQALSSVVYRAEIKRLNVFSVDGKIRIVGTLPSFYLKSLVIKAVSKLDFDVDLGECLCV